MIGQGESAERLAERAGAGAGLSRAELDRYGWESHRRAAHAAEQGWLDRELIAVTGIDASGQPIRLTRDEGVRPNASLAKMAALKPAFRADGVVTAATSSQISDGAALVLVADRERAVADGFRPRARFRARVVMGGDPTLQLAEVVPATVKALEVAGLTLGDLDWVEINEAFAPVPLFWLAELGVDPARVNPVGGAIAHGHPLGATGAVLMAKLLHGLERTGGRFGLQVMCVARGMATATIIERL
jgi:acetyl-CoA C-acetyltransferase